MFKRVVFISLPMSGIDDDLVRENIEKAKAAYLVITGLDISQVVFINNLDCEKGPDSIDKTHLPTYYLGKALQKLAGCDEAFFWGDWKKARGCMIEHEVCTLYDIPTISVERSGYHG